MGEKRIPWIISFFQMCFQKSKPTSLLITCFRMKKLKKIVRTCTRSDLCNSWEVFLFPLHSSWMKKKKPKIRNSKDSAQFEARSKQRSSWQLIPKCWKWWKANFLQQRFVSPCRFRWLIIWRMQNRINGLAFFFYLKIFFILQSLLQSGGEQAAFSFFQFRRRGNH